MTPKIRATLVTFSIAATVLVGAAAALPPYFPSGTSPTDPHLGPRAGPCTPTALGWGGTSAGTTTDYHRYGTDNTIPTLDSCVPSGTSGEFDYGGGEAVLPVRTGSSSAGPGFGCLGSAGATAHHASDTTVYVADAALGGSVGFSVGYDTGCGSGFTEIAHVNPGPLGSAFNSWTAGTSLGTSAANAYDGALVVKLDLDSTAGWIWTGS